MLDHGWSHHIFSQLKRLGKQPCDSSDRQWLETSLAQRQGVSGTLQEHTHTSTDHRKCHLLLNQQTYFSRLPIADFLKIPLHSCVMKSQQHFPAAGCRPLYSGFAIVHKSLLLSLDWIVFVYIQIRCCPKTTVMALGSSRSWFCIFSNSRSLCFSIAAFRQPALHALVNTNLMSVWPRLSHPPRSTSNCFVENQTRMFEVWGEHLSANIPMVIEMSDAIKLTASFSQMTENRNAKHLCVWSIFLSMDNNRYPFLPRQLEFVICAPRLLQQE